MTLEANTNGLMRTHQAVEKEGGSLWADRHQLDKA